MTIALVAAMDAAGLLGVGGRLPWHLPADLAHFRALTMGRVVIMGRRTWEGLPGPLWGRTSVVLSRSMRPWRNVQHAITVGSLAMALDYAGDEGACIIGGAGVFAEALPLADTLHLTRIAHTFPAGEGAVYFPRWDEAAFRCVAREERAADAANAWGMVFETWER